jgi:dipeptidyl aminopeptidase/acylaminoacyl peptidase
VEPTTPAEKIAEKKYFVSASAGKETALETLQFLAATFGHDSLSALLKHNVERYTITYRTVYKGEDVKASGVLLLPQNLTTEAPVVSLQHGTTFQKSDAPSVNSGFQGMEFFASAGYITLIPDYLGYGESDEIFHPYYDQEHAASTVIDLVKAAKEFLKRGEIPVSDKLFLAGYSEGGYVTLAAAKEIEEEPAHGMKLTAVAAGAGGYDLLAMHKSITDAQYYSYPSYLAFVMMSYNQTYDWNKPLSYFFNGHYADSLAKYLNGNHGGGFINSKLTNHIPSLLNPRFYDGLRGDGETGFKLALKENSVAGWKTQVPIRLFHGTRDEIIPYQNSEITLERFQAAGSNNVTLKLIPGGTHGNSFEPMLRDFIPWFLAL